MNWSLELAVLIAVAISLGGTFLARHAAVRLDWLDQPSHRKVHANPIPLLGGIAMYMAFLISVLVTNSRTVLAEGTTVLIGATLLLVVGIIDDQRGLSPRTKLLAQACAAILLVIGGAGVGFFPFAWMNLAVTIIWVAAICNAMNLLDNMDGLSAGVAAIACAFFTLAGAVARADLGLDGRRGAPRGNSRLPSLQLEPGDDLHGRLRGACCSASCWPFWLSNCASRTSIPGAPGRFPSHSGRADLRHDAL